MPDREVHSTMRPLANAFMQEIMTHYIGPLYHYVSKRPELIAKVPGFLLQPESVIVYIGQTHIGLEYVGPEFIEELESQSIVEMVYHDLTKSDKNMLEEIIGFEYDSSVDIEVDMLPVSEDLILPTNAGLERLIELGWNFGAQSSLMAFNSPCPNLPKGVPVRIVNGAFFDADEAGLKVRRIKWIDFFPIFYDDSDSEIDSVKFSVQWASKLVEFDAKYSFNVPDDFKFIQLPKINKFIELWGSSGSTEVDITSFLAEDENQFILSMKFGASSVHSEILCEWQNEDRASIKPDFFVVQPNGYADIVEFKLPTVPGKTTVGKDNREAFAAWLSSYIAQTRVYSSYFADSANRKWFEEKYGFKVHNPRRWLVVGRRSDFSSSAWREIVGDYKDLEILTFDDMVDGVSIQFYK